jgi:tetratricopeptide (TPR) repeat protein
VARGAALQTAARVNLPELMREQGFAGLQHYWMTPWFDRVRFGRWDEIVERPNPAPDLPYVTAIWHYAQAMADVRQSRLESASRHYDALAKLAADPVMEQLMVWDRYSLANAVRIAERTVAAEIALTRKDPDTAIAALREAVKFEDQIPYDEPPGWHAPVRQTLGAVLLATNRPAEAERVYREELQRNQDNGWSLRGLSDSLAAQKRHDEARQTEQQFAAAWAHADVKLAQSRF